MTILISIHYMQINSSLFDKGKKKSTHSSLMCSCITEVSQHSNWDFPYKHNFLIGNSTAHCFPNPLLDYALNQCIYHYAILRNT